MKPRPFLLLLLLAACADGPAALVVHAPPHFELHVGETALLDATTAAANAPLTYRWTLEEQPASTAPLLIGVSASRLHFTASVAGDYLVSVTVSDGSRISAPAVSRLVVRPAPVLAGTLTVRVLDASNRQPLPGAEVSVEGLKSTTDVDGLAVLAGPGLHAPVTVHVTSAVSRRYDHDDDPATPAMDWPWYRGATVIDVRTPELTVELHPTVEAQVSVHGRIDASLFELIPEVAPTFSLGTGHASGQARVVMVAPLPRKPLDALQPRDLFTPRDGSHVPANLATDDESLAALAPFLGVKWQADGASLTRFHTRAVPGRQTFFVLGGIVTLHLDGVKWQAQADQDIQRRGRFTTALSFAGLITLDVPPQGLDLSEALRPETLDELWQLDTRIEHEEEHSTDLLTGEAQRLERVKLTGGREVRAPAPPLVPDPRLEHWQERYLTFSNASGEEQRLRVPHQTGPATTDLPFHLLIASATTPAGVVPLGFALVRDMDRKLEEASFRWPAPTGSLAGARFEVMALAARGLWTSKGDAGLVPGDTRQLVEVLDEHVSSFELSPLPHEPSNRWNGLMNQQMGERADPERLPFDRVRAVPLFVHTGLPGNPGRELLLDTPGHTRVHTVLSRRLRQRREGTLFRDNYGLWDIHQPAGHTTKVPLPDLETLPYLDEHTDLRVEVTATSVNRRIARDTFLIRLP